MMTRTKATTGKNAPKSQAQTQEAALAGETDQQDVSIVEAFVEPQDRIHRYCAVCSATATLFSASGREDSAYCEKHGHCKRCNGSVEEFVKHPNFTNYLCPCVVGAVIWHEKQKQREENLKSLKQAKPVTFGF